MTIRCPSCGVQLRADEQRMGARAGARCPKCRSLVPLASGAQPPQSSATSFSAQGSETIKVECSSCGAKLKAPASRAGRKSRCPKCKEEVAIGLPGPHPASIPRDAPEEISGAATRRIDARTLGLAVSGATAAEETPRLGPAANPSVTLLKAPAAGAPPSAPSPAADTAISLLRPPVEKLGKIAGEIRSAAEEFAPRPLPPPSMPAPARAPAPRPTLAEPPRQQNLPYPTGRGVLAGGASGLAWGAAWAGVGMLGLGPLLAPLPFSGDLLGLPDTVLRVALSVALGALTGFIAAGSGSPLRTDAPLSFARCGGFGLLTGAACGMAAAVMSGAGLQIWPVAHWMRDLLLIGLLTSATNKMFPRDPSGAD